MVDTLDKLPGSEQGLSAALLNDLQTAFVDSRFDLRELIRSIMLSDAYQRSSVTAMPKPSGDAVAKAPVKYPVTKQAAALEPGAKKPTGEKPAGDTAGGEKSTAGKPAVEKAPEKPAPKAAQVIAMPAPADPQLALFARARIRPLSADQLHLSLGSSLGFYYDDNDHRLAVATGEEFTYDVPRQSFSEVPASLRRSLALFNSEHVRGAADVAAESTLRVFGNAAGAEHIERLFQMLLVRKPAPEELELLLELAGGDSPKSGLEDVAWVLLNSAEFNTNH